MIKFEVVPFESAWVFWEKEWLKLYDRSQSPCAFCHPIFLSAAKILPENEKPTHLVLGQDDGSLVFGLPIQIVSRYGFIKEFRSYTISSEGFDHLCPLDTTNDYELSRKFFYDVIHGGGLTFLKIPNAKSELAQLLEMDKKEALFIKHIVSHCPYLTLPECEADLKSLLDNKYLYNLLRDIKRMEERGFKFRIVTEADGVSALHDSLRSLFYLHEMRSKAIQRRSGFSSSIQTKEYHGALCSAAQNYPGLVHFFEIIYEDRTIASLYGFFSKRAFYFYQSGFCPDQAKYSLGSALIYYAMLYCIKKRGTTFDFMRGGEYYKTKWTNACAIDYHVLMGKPPFGSFAFETVIRMRRFIQRSLVRLI